LRKNKSLKEYVSFSDLKIHLTPILSSNHERERDMKYGLMPMICVLGLKPK
jgi:hypothetical protein